MEASYEIYLSGVAEESHEFMDKFMKDVDKLFNENNITANYIRVETTKRFVYDKDERD